VKLLRGNIIGPNDLLRLLSIFRISKNKEAKSISNVLCNTKELAMEHFRLGEHLLRGVIPYWIPKFKAIKTY
jgi:hypothetical protein